MTNQRASANNELHSENRLSMHIQDVQDQATRLHGILCAIEHLDDDGTCPDGMAALTRTAREISKNLADNLDSVNLPEGRTDG